MSELGVKSATTTKVGLIDKESHLYALPRILDGEAISEFELSGFNEIMIRLISIIRQKKSLNLPAG